MARTTQKMGDQKMAKKQDQAVTEIFLIFYFASSLINSLI
jgi:hypothetical protein